MQRAIEFAATIEISSMESTGSAKSDPKHTVDDVRQQLKKLLESLAPTNSEIQ